MRMRKPTPHSADLRKGRRSEQGRIYFITTSCYRRRRIFSESGLALIVIDEFKRRAAEGHCQSLAYVVMPDHIHWLVKLNGETKLHQLLKIVKGHSARRINLARSTTAAVWQCGYHDHALRADEDIEAVANYLIQNPLRAGLVGDVNEYPFWDSIWHGRFRD